jgi:dTDP-4-amino-4,6-dideoxygalactose transaminase
MHAFVGEYARSCPQGPSFCQKGSDSKMNVPFLDLVTPHVELEEELVGAFRGALRSAGFIGGAAVDGFEREFARFSEAKYCVGVASGTDALRFALMAAGVQPGSSAITVCNTFIATTEAISQVGRIC